MSIDICSKAKGNDGILVTEDSSSTSADVNPVQEEKTIPVTMTGSDDILTESPTQELTTEKVVVEAGKHTKRL